MAFFIAGINVCYSQEYLDSLNIQSKKMAKGFMNKEYNTLLKYTHPNIIKMGGGKTKIIQLIAKEMNTIENNGFKFTEVAMGQPIQVIKTDKNIQAILPQTIVLSKFDKDVKSITYLWAISYNNGKNWFFSEVNQSSRKRLETAFPEMNKKLNIPSKKINHN